MIDMPKFAVEATVHFTYHVEAESKEAAEALLTERLGPNWHDQEQIEDPRIEPPFIDAEIMGLYLVEEKTS
jgi:hypothetical protein